jgi:hypothetical protein
MSFFDLKSALRTQHLSGEWQCVLQMSSKDWLGRRQVCQRPLHVPDHEHCCGEDGFVQRPSLIFESCSENLLHLFDGQLSYAV